MVAPTFNPGTVIIQNWTSPLLDDGVTSVPLYSISDISSNLIRDGQVLQKIYPYDFVVNNKLGPTGKPRGMLDSSKLFDTFSVRLKYNTYEETIRDYYGKYENLRSKQ